MWLKDGGKVVYEGKLSREDRVRLERIHRGQILRWEEREVIDLKPFRVR